MDNRQRYLEDNTARLIRAGLGAPVRLDPLTRQQTLRRLVARLQAKRAVAAFPDWALVILAAALVLAAAWVAGQTLTAGIAVVVSPPLIIMALLWTSSLAWLPLAAVVIVVRRRHA